MATGPGVTKKAFLESVLDENPSATEEQINAAWQAAGYEGTISESLIYKIRAAKGLTGKGRPGRRKRAAGRKVKVKRAAETAGKLPPPEVRAGAVSLPEELEADFDRLLFKVMDQGMPEVEEAIREARRALIRRHQG